MASRLEVENTLRDILELLEDIDRSPVLAGSPDASLKRIHARAAVLSTRIRDFVHMIHTHWRQG